MSTLDLRQRVGRSRLSNLQTVAYALFVLFLLASPVTGASPDCRTLFETSTETSGPSFGHRLIPASELRSQLLIEDEDQEMRDHLEVNQQIDAPRIKAARERMKETLKEAYSFLNHRSRGLWQNLRASNEVAVYDLVFVGLGPNAVASYSSLVSEFYRKHGRAPKVLIVGKELGGAFSRATEFYLNTGYGPAIHRIHSSRETVHWGFSPHDTGFALDPIEVVLTNSVYSKRLANRVDGNPFLSPTNAVEGKIGSAVFWNHRKFVNVARQEGDLYSADFYDYGNQAKFAPFQYQHRVLQPVLKGLRAAQILFLKNSAIADSIALELARLNADVLEGVDVSLDHQLTPGSRKKIYLRKGKQKIEIESSNIALFPGPGEDYIPFEKDTPSYEFTRTELTKHLHGKVLTTETIMRALKHPLERALLLKRLKGKRILFMGNGDSSLVAMETLFDLKPYEWEEYRAVRPPSDVPSEIANDLRRNFLLSTASRDLIKNLLNNGSRLTADGAETLSKSPMQGDRYRHLLSWLLQNPKNLIDDYIVSVLPDSGSDEVSVCTRKGACYKTDLVILGTGKKDALPEMLGPSVQLKAIHRKILDFFSPLSGAIDRHDTSRTDSELTSQEIEQAPVVSIGLMDPDNGIFVGGYTGATVNSTRLDVQSGAAPSVGGRGDLLVPNPAGLPNQLPRARELGRFLYQMIYRQ